MTRDDAIKAWDENVTANRVCITADLIKGFVALGILKLDEPKSMAQKLRDFVSDTRLVQGDAMQRMEGLHRALDAQGLKIIEK